MTKQQATDRAIARYTRFGNEQQGRELLADLIDRHSGCNLASALHYWGFAAANSADRMAAALEGQS